MKIVMLCEFYNEELDYQEALLAKYYCLLGHDVVVITGVTTSVHDYIAGSNAKAEQRVEVGQYARIYRMPVMFTLLRRILVYSSIKNILEKEAPDLLYFHDIMPNMLEAVPYLSANVSACAIMDYHADFSNSGATRLSRLVLHRLSRRLILMRMRRRLSAILPIVPGSQRFLHQLYGIPPQQTELFPLGVDTLEADAARASSARADIRGKLGIPTDALVVFTGGKLTRLKRTEDVLRAVTKLDDARVHVIVVGTVIGDDSYKAELVRAAGPTTHFVGWQDRGGIYRHQAAADLAIFPYSQSVLWQQSIGMGLPLVVGEGRDIGRARQDVGYMNRGNIEVLDRSSDPVEQIARFIEGACNDRSILDAMSTAAQEVTRDLLSYERLARRTLKITNAHRLSVGASPLPIDPLSRR